jgi:hypothetical protein
MISIFDIFKKLGLNSDNGLFIKNPKVESDTFSDLYSGNFLNYKSNFKVEYSLKKLKPDAIFIFNNEPLILFFDFDDKLNKDQLKAISKNIWNFNKSAIIFINTTTELTIYNGFKYNKSGLLEILETLTSLQNSNIENYSYWKIVSSELWIESEKFSNKNRVDKKLLDNIKSARNELVGNKDQKDNPNNLDKKHANRIIARLIFIRYLIDRNVNFDFTSINNEMITKNELPNLIKKKELLYKLFEDISEKFNGELLPINGEKDSIKEEHLSILSNLFAGESINKRQMSLFNVFDFDYIPIELISNIYETFLGEQQDTEKAFYTPPFLVDYVLEQTVKPFIDNIYNPEELICKTVDFTCGSGIFLCETLRIIINKYIELSKPDRSSIEFKEKIKKLLTDNIFGNDVNQEAIEIAKFSLFITLLDYFEDPKDIENFQFPPVNGNFYNLDVFFKGSYEENKEKNEFIIKLELNDIFGKNKLIEPDFIIGNPPWGDLSQRSNYIEYCKERSVEETKEKKQFWKKENSDINSFIPIHIQIGNKEFAQAFLIRLSDFSTPKTICQIIVTSKLLYNLQSNKFRNYLLTNFILSEVLEISSVRHLVFEGAVGPAAIIKYKYAFHENTENNLIDYVSLKPNPFFALFKSILIEKYDYKEVIQKELIENDWLWKVLVYGHVLDYQFIKRLRNKNEFPVTLGNLIEDSNNKNRPLYARTGIMVGNKQGDVSNYIGMYFINTKTSKTKKFSDLQRFYIHFNSKSKWNIEKAEGIRNEKVFKNPPMILIKQGFNTNYELVSSISYISAIFTRSIYSISTNTANKEIIENILGLVNSNLMNYYILTNCLSSINERERLVNEELNDFVILENHLIITLVKDLIKIRRLIEIRKYKLNIDNICISEYEELFAKKENELNQLVYQLYNLSDTERDLISYTQEITIPILQAKSKSYKEISENSNLFKPYIELKSDEISDYINIFMEHFSLSHNGGKNGYFNTRIFKSQNILAIEFYIDSIKHEVERNYNLENNIILENLSSLGFQKVSNQLFIQKDIKVLKSNSFSVVKPNQYKYWHKAIARLDLIEFQEAMINSQSKSSYEQN